MAVSAAPARSFTHLSRLTLGSYSDSLGHSLIMFSEMVALKRWQAATSAPVLTPQIQRS